MSRWTRAGQFVLLSLGSVVAACAAGPLRQGQFTSAPGVGFAFHEADPVDIELVFSQAEAVVLRIYAAGGDEPIDTVVVREPGSITVRLERGGVLDLLNEGANAAPCRWTVVRVP